VGWLFLCTWEILWPGNPLADIDSTADQMEHYGLLVASVDESLIELPTEPEEKSEDEPDEADKKKKAYLLAIKERDETLKSSQVSLEFKDPAP